MLNGTSNLLLNNINCCLCKLEIWHVKLKEIRQFQVYVRKISVSKMTITKIEELLKLVDGLPNAQWR